MPLRDASPSPPAAGSITVATGPLPSTSRSPPAPEGTNREDAPVVVADTITAAPVAEEQREPASAAEGESAARVGSDAQSVAAAATAAAAAAASAAAAAGPGGAVSGKEAGSGGDRVVVGGDEMEGVENTSATTATTTTAAAGPSRAEEKTAATASRPTTSTGVDASTAQPVASSSGKESGSKVTRGAFVVFEGLDRAGKTTQAKLLQQRFIESGRDVVYMRFPDRTTPIGQMIDAYLRGETETEDHVIHLLFSANRWEAINKIKTLLASGKTIICDRYYHSGIVYSAAKHLPSLPLSWAKAPEAGLPRPDMVLFLDLEESVARSRGGWGGEVYERGEMQRRVRELFWGLSMGDLGKTGAGPGGNVSGVSGITATTSAGLVNPFQQEQEDIQIVDANLGVEELSDKVWDVVVARVEAVERGEVGKSVRTVQ